MTDYEYTFKKLPVTNGRVFRLFKLRPGIPGKPVEGELLVRRIQTTNDSHSSAGIDKADSYISLSKRVVSPIRATQPHAALETLRDVQYPRIFWIDAICINQKDKEEKSSQITFMSHIYGQAQQVYVWLGASDGNSHIALDFVRDCQELDILDRMVENRESSKQWAALSSLMRRRWFSRRWIIQEIAMAKSAELYCGADHVGWKQFVAVVSHLSPARNELRTMFRKDEQYGNPIDFMGDLTESGAVRLVEVSNMIVRRSRDGRVKRHNLSLEALISLMSAFEASQPHDVIYAILWLANDANPTPPAPRPTTPLKHALKRGLSPSDHTGPSMTRRRAEETGKVPSISISVPYLDVGDAQSLSPADVHSMQPNLHVEHGIDPAGQWTSHMVQTPVSETADPLGSMQSSPDKLGNPARLRQRQTPWSTVTRTQRTRSLSQITDPKERLEVAGEMFLSGLATTKRLRRFYVDYERSVFEVCRDLMIFVTERSKSLDIMFRPWAPEHDDMPSWLCPLTKRPFRPNHRGKMIRQHADPLVGKYGRGSPCYSASKAPSVDVLAEFPPERHRILRVRGFCIATISTDDEIKDSSLGGVIPQDWADGASWTDRSQPPPDDFWRTLMADRSSNGDDPDTVWDQACKAAYSWNGEDDLETTQILTEPRGTRVSAFLERARCVIWKRRLVVLHETSFRPQTLCLAPRYIKSGDQICVLYGCSVPVLLRRHTVVDPQSLALDALSGVQSPQRESFECEVIGECYVHDFMDGEAHDLRSKAKRGKEELDEIYELR